MFTRAALRPFLHLHLHLRLLLICSQLLLAAVTCAAQEAGGNGSLSGDVIDSVNGGGIARARVTMMATSRSDHYSREAATDTNGRFMVSGLPAGEYLFWVNKFGYLPSTGGAGKETLRGQADTRIRIDRNQQQHVRVTLTPAAVILGRVLDPDGEPMEGASVTLLRASSPSALSRARETNSVRTNDAGEFRIPRVEPGSYLLMAMIRRSSNEGRDSELAATYYPSVISAAEAVPIDVARGSSVSGLEITLRDVKLTTISGRVIDRQGQPLQSGTVHVSADRDGRAVPLASSVSSGGDIQSDGTFRLRVPAGEYWLTVADSEGIGSVSMDPRMAALSREQMQAAYAAIEQHLRARAGFAALRVSAGAQALDQVTLQLQPPVSISGRIVFEGRGNPEFANIASFQLSGRAEAEECRVMGSPRLEPPLDGTFDVMAMPGTCVPMVFAPPGWFVKAIQIGNADMTNRALTLEPGRNVTDVRVILTEQRNELSFKVIDSGGAPTTDYIAVVFPVDDALWTLEQNVLVYVSSERSTGQRPPREISGPAHGGIGRIGNVTEPLSGLTPGDYYAIALDDGSWEELSEPAMLQRLAEKAVKFQIREGEIRSVDLRRTARTDF